MATAILLSEFRRGRTPGGWQERLLASEPAVIVVSEPGAVSVGR